MIIIEITIRSTIIIYIRAMTLIVGMVFIIDTLVGMQILITLSVLLVQEKFALNVASA